MIPLADFSGGLNLRDASGVLDPRYAIDLLNVEFSTRGAVVERPGTAVFTGDSGLSRYDALFPFYTTAGGKRLLASRGTVVEALDAAGAVDDSQTGLSGGPHYFERFAAPGVERIYIGNGTDKIFKYSGSAFTAPAAAGMPRGKFLAIQSPDNRLVTAGFETATGGPSGAATNPSTVWFSEAGDPDTWAANDYVHLDPGDGEEITGMASWGTYVFVFKQTKFFVFTGNGEQSDGSPEFIFRPEKNQVGCAAPRAIAVGRDGVYFLSRSGIYRTAGGPAELVSSNIDALFNLAPLPGFYTGQKINQAEIAGAAATFWNERLYFAVPTGSSATNDRVLVFDPRFGWWSVYDLPAAALATFRPGDEEELMFAFAAGSNLVGRHSRSYANDAGEAISAWCRIGFFQPADGGGETHLRFVRVIGSGLVTVKVSVDYATGKGFGIVADLDASVDLWGDGSDVDDVWADGTDAADTWGPSQEFTSEVLTGFGQLGRFYSLTFENTTLDRSMHVERAHLDFRGSRAVNV